MKYRLLGGSGLRVSELCLGTMTFTDGLTGWGTSRADAFAIMEAYAGAGGNFLDTADLYFGRDGVSEEVVGEFISRDRDHFVVATKYSATNTDDVSNSGSSVKNMRRSVEASLRRLGTDHVDLYWMHHWDMMTPIEEVVRGLDHLVSSGKVRYVGLSNTPAWLVSRAHTLATAHFVTPPVAVQVEYNLLERSAEQEQTPMAHALDLAVCAWSPLGGGLLTGKYLAEERGTGTGRRLDDAQGRHTRPPLFPRHREIIDTVVAVAGRRDATPAQVAIAWLLSRPGCVPVAGATRVEQVRDVLGAARLMLPAEDLAALDAVSEPVLGVPQSFLQAAHLRRSLSSGHWDDIVNHRDPAARPRTTQAGSEELFNR
jgi:aryl-alcohol dehydrogenase-like predicted oxidoreductase